MKYLLFILVFSLVSAQLTVEKYVSNGELTVGDQITISVNITNNFGEDLPLQIHSRDVVSNTGVDVLCYELTIPSGESTIEITKIPTGVPGEFTINKTLINYTNPDTGTRESVESDEIEITVSGTMSSVLQESITTVYECNGTSVTSTSTSVTATSQQQQTEEQKQQTQQQMDERLQQNQMSQDSKALKQQLNKDMEEQKALVEEFEKNLQENQELKDLMKELEEQGYKMKEKSLNPENNNTGEFQYEYEKQGETAEISGEMQEGNMENLESKTSEQAKKLEEQLAQNQEYQEYVDELSQAGFNKTGFEYQENGNMSQTTTTFENEQGETANITADVEDEVDNVELNRKRDRNWWWLLLFSVLLLGLVILFKRKKPMNDEVKEEAIFDYIAEAQKMLDTAKKLFRLKKYKDAYGMAGEALRMFYSYKYGESKELTATDTLFLLKRKKIPYSEARKCLGLCGLVEFAKYKPNKKDFDAIVKIAKQIILNTEATGKEANDTRNNRSIGKNK